MYKSHLGRSWETFKETVDTKRPIASSISAVSHVFTDTLGFDPAVKDIGRGIHGDKSPLNPYTGYGAKTREAFREIITDVGVFKDASDDKRHFRPVGALTKGINLVGGMIDDGVNIFLSIDRKSNATRHQIHTALAS